MTHTCLPFPQHWTVPAPVTDACVKFQGSSTCKFHMLTIFGICFRTINVSMVIESGVLGYLKSTLCMRVIHSAPFSVSGRVLPLYNPSKRSRIGLDTSQIGMQCVPALLSEEVPDSNPLPTVPPSCDYSSVRVVSVWASIGSRQYLVIKLVLV